MKFCQNSKYFLFILVSLYNFTFYSGVSAEQWYYLSSLGYVIKINLNDISETGQIAAGSMPWAGASYKEHIYFTDFATDQVFDFDSKDKLLNKIKIELDSSARQEIAVYDKTKKEAKKPPMRIAFERVRKPKKKPETYNPLKEPLEIKKHNKRVGLSAIAVSDKYIFVGSSLNSKVEVLDRTSLARIASLAVAERPSHLSVSPNENILAINSNALNKVYLVDINKNFERKAEIEVGEGPTEMVWLNDDILFVLNRGENTLSVISSNTNSKIKNIELETPVNSMTLSLDKKFLFAMDGTEKKMYIINTSTNAIEKKEIKEDLKFPNILHFLNADELLIGSESDGRLLIINAKTFDTIRKIQTNLPPRYLMRVEN